MRILVVDDNIGFLDVMAQLLRDYGYQVVGAEDGKQAREFLDIEKVDLIISDVFMPILNGAKFHSLVVNPDIDFFFSKTTPVETIVDLIEKLKVVNRTPRHQYHQLI